MYQIPPEGLLLIRTLVYKGALMNSTTSDAGDPVRAAFAEVLGTTDFDIVAEVTGRLPSGEELRLVHAAVRGKHNQTASLVVDASGEVQPLRTFEALAGRGLRARNARAGAACR